VGTLDLEDGIKDVQTTQGGKIWVRYFDEGVYGGGAGQHGVICFDSSGRSVFRYSEFAEQLGLPSIDDCYAMKVASEDEVWLSYYSDFPLVAERMFQLEQIWKEFGCMASGFGLFSGYVFSPKCYTQAQPNAELLRRTISEPSQIERLEAIDDTGKKIEGHFRVAARGSRLYLYNHVALYDLAST
jgi:hypothetical protein